ncbi:MAG TPA: mismatch-specific DNA-glycosylase [Kofleriaceae bacterium]|nr:mismatch-specific DNA-glycosylase [Kofleriaceae bacterium]
MPRPRDVIAKRPRILFVGINPGATSGKVGHHFAGAGNPFWKLLHAAGLTPVELTAAEDGRLPEFGHALVNLCARPTKTAAELSRKELQRGRELLLEKIREMKPRVVALVGITLYPLVLGLKGKLAHPGPGAKPETLEGARVFVVPNPSGLNASFPTFAAKLPWFEALGDYAGMSGQPSPRSK